MIKISILQISQILAMFVLFLAILPSCYVSRGLLLWKYLQKLLITLTYKHQLFSLLLETLWFTFIETYLRSTAEEAKVDTPQLGLMS